MFSNCAGDDVMNESILERVNKCKRTFMLSELVDLQRVQCVGAVNDYNGSSPQAWGTVLT